MDQIVQNPQTLDSVIGFLCTDLTSFATIQYLSFDSIHQVEADVSIHLFRRRTFGYDSEGHLRGFFLYLSSLSDRISWGPPPSRAETRQKSFHNELLIQVLENTLIGDFKPVSNHPITFLKEVETLTRNAGLDFDHQIFVIPDQFHKRFKEIGFRSYPTKSGVSPDWSIMDLINDYTETLGLYFYIQNGVFTLVPLHSPLRQTQVYRINPGQLARWIEWANAVDPLFTSADFRKMAWVEERAFRIIDDENNYPPFFERDPFASAYQPEDFDRQSLTREKIEYYLSLPRETSCAKDGCNSVISGTDKYLSPFSPKDSTTADRILNLPLYTPRGPVTWIPPDQLHIKLYPNEIHDTEDLLYSIQTGLPDR